MSSDTHRYRSIISLIIALAVTPCTVQSSSADTLPTRTAQVSSGDDQQESAMHRLELIDSFNVGERVYVRSLAVEHATASMWVGTSAGVLEVDINSRELRNTFTRDDGLANEYVFAIFVDSRGNKWFGTNAGGASRYKDGDWKVFFPMHGLADYWVYAFDEQLDGPLWIGTWAGANSVDLDTMHFKTYVEDLINEWVYAIGIDSRNRVWFGTEGGVSLLDNGRWRHWTHEDGLGAPNPGRPLSKNTGLGTRSRHSLNVLEEGLETYNPSYVFSLAVDSSDVVWAGTWGGGVARFDGTSWTNFTMADGLSGNIVYSVTQDNKGVMWFGTNHGVTRFDGTEWTTIDSRHGLLDDNVYAVAVAPSGDIWVGTKRGVSILSDRGDQR